MVFSGSSALLLVLLGFAVGAFGTLVGAGGGFILAPVLLILYPHDSAPSRLGRRTSSYESASTSGLRLGSHLNKTLRERAEQLAGLALLALAVLLGVEKLA